MDGREWLTLMNATPTLAKNIADAFGKTELEIRSMGTNGLLSIEMLNEGLRKSMDENKAAADSMAILLMMHSRN